jgi:hypothetical protein
MSWISQEILYVQLKSISEKIISPLVIFPYFYAFFTVRILKTKKQLDIFQSLFVG